MSYLHPHLGEDDVLTLLNQATGFLAPGATVETPPQGVNNRTYLVREAGLVVKVRPGGEGPCAVPCPHWPAYTCALFGDVPNGGVRSLAAITETLQHHGGLRVPALYRIGEGTGPDGSDFTIAEILPGRPYDWETHRLGRHACRQLGEHLGSLHHATAETEGFGIFGGEPIRWTQWWSRFAASYSILADDVCDRSPVLHNFRRRLENPIQRALRSPDPRAFPLVCVDQNPSHYLGNGGDEISGFVDVEGHLHAPAEWELTTALMWMPHPQSFRRGYETHRAWPESMDDVRDAYATYTLLEWIVCTRDLMRRPEEVANLEAWLIGTFA